MKPKRQRHPKWLKVPLPVGNNFHDIRSLIKQQNLHTVCESAHCPNIGECWNSRTATFMILGNICTRNCHFCAITSDKPVSVDINEPYRVAAAIKNLNLKYAVITSVTRDDLSDGGASIFAETIKQIKKQVSGCQVEVLIPDLAGSEVALNIIIEAQPDVLNHNLETIPRLYPQVRPQASYKRSLQLLSRAKKAEMTTKSGIMLGLGETIDEIYLLMEDLRKIHCDILTVGQYLQPSAEHFPISRYVTPNEFKKIKHDGMKMGFRYIESSPLTRSSYHAASQPLTKV